MVRSISLSAEASGGFLASLPISVLVLVLVLVLLLALAAGKMQALSHQSSQALQSRRCLVGEGP